MRIKIDKVENGFLTKINKYKTKGGDKIKVFTSFESLVDELAQQFEMMGKGSSYTYYLREIGLPENCPMPMPPTDLFEGLDYGDGYDENGFDELKKDKDEPF